LSSEKLKGDSIGHRSALLFPQNIVQRISRRQRQGLLFGGGL
jgi:hypothetical protein